MKVLRSAGAVIYKHERDKIFYLLLHYDAGHWDFPKGHIEKGERTADTIRREVQEETGITDLEFIDGFKKAIKYIYKLPPRGEKPELRPAPSGAGLRLKFVAFLLARTKSKKVTLSHEHQDFTWLPYALALKQLTYKTAQEVLRTAHDFLAS